MSAIKNGGVSQVPEKGATSAPVWFLEVLGHISPCFNGNKCGGTCLTQFSHGVKQNHRFYLMALLFPAIKYLVLFPELPSELQIHGEHLWSQAIFYSCSKDCAEDSGERHEQALPRVRWWLNSLWLSIFWYFWLFSRSNLTCFSTVCYSQKTFFTHINCYNIFEH